MLLAPAALLGVRGEVWVDADAASRCPMLTYRWIHQPGLLDLQLHSDTSVMLSGGGAGSVEKKPMCG